MSGTDSGCRIRDCEVRCYPIEIGVRGEQSVKLIDSLLPGVPIRLNKQFRQGDCGRYRCVARLFQPREDMIGETHISRIGFQLVYEGAGIKRDSAMIL